jgi:antitoxin component YwqK of YwqJK toxin-antitoxin module
MMVVEEEYWYPGGPVAIREYSEDGQYHREDGAAFEEFYPWGIQAQANHYKRGKLDRENGPAVLFFDEDGRLEDVEFWRNGKRWRPSAHDRLAMNWDPTPEIEAARDKTRSVPTCLMEEK